MKNGKKKVKNGKNSERLNTGEIEKNMKIEKTKCPFEINWPLQNDGKNNNHQLNFCKDNSFLFTTERIWTSRWDLSKL